jgi:hypothetical protein
MSLARRLEGDWARLARTEQAHLFEPELLSVKDDQTAGRLHLVTGSRGGPKVLGLRVHSESEGGRIAQCQHTQPLLLGVRSQTDFGVEGILARAQLVDLKHLNYTQTTIS